MIACIKFKSIDIILPLPLLSSNGCYLYSAILMPSIVSQLREIHDSAPIIAVFPCCNPVLPVGSCKKSAQATGGMPAFPVQVQKVALQQVGDSAEFLATLQSRNAAILQPEVEGQITKIFVDSGAHVDAGQPIMEIDPRRQQATVNQQVATKQSQQATLAYNQSQLERSRKLFDAGVISRQEYDNAVSAHDASKANVEATDASINQQRVQLHYFTVRAPVGRHHRRHPCPGWRPRDQHHDAHHSGPWWRTRGLHQHSLGALPRCA